MFFSKPDIPKLKGKKDVYGLWKIFQKSFKKGDKIFAKESIEAIAQIGHRNAIKILQEIGSQNIDQLITLLNHEDLKIKRSAIKALGGIRNPQSVDPLLEYVKHYDSFIKYDVIEALGKIKDPKALHPLMKIQHYASEPLKKEIYKTIANIGGAKAFLYYSIYKENLDESIKIGRIKEDAFIGELNDKNSPIKAIAVQSLGKLKSRRAVELLLNMLSNKDVDMDQCIIEALGEIGDPKAIDALVNFLNKPLEEIDESKKNAQYIRIKSAKALGKLNDPRGINFLIQDVSEDLKEYTPLLNSLCALKEIECPVLAPLLKKISSINNKHWSKFIFETLKILADKENLTPLVEMLNSSDADESALAAKILQIPESPEIKDVFNKIKKCSDPDCLAKFLSHENPAIRQYAVILLEDLKQPQSIKHLKSRLLHDKDWEVKKTAAITLGKIKDPSGIEPLIHILRDEGMFLWDLRDAIVDALIQIGEPVIEPVMQLLNKKVIAKPLLNDIRTILTGINNSRIIETLIGLLGQEKPLSTKYTIITILEYFYYNEIITDKEKQLIVGQAKISGLKHFDQPDNHVDQSSSDCMHTDKGMRHFDKTTGILM